MKTRINKDTNKVNEIEKFEGDFIVLESIFSINVEIYLFLKHYIHELFLFINITVAYDILYEILYCLSIVRCNFKVSSLVFILSRQNTINKNLK